MSIEVVQPRRTVGIPSAPGKRRLRNPPIFGSHPKSGTVEGSRCSPLRGSHVDGTKGGVRVFRIPVRSRGGPKVGGSGPFSTLLVLCRYRRFRVDDSTETGEVFGRQPRRSLEHVDVLVRNDRRDHLTPTILQFVSDWVRGFIQSPPCRTHVFQNLVSS